MCDLVSGAMAALSTASALTGAAATVMSEKARAEATNAANLHKSKTAIKQQLDLSNLEGIKTSQNRQSLANQALEEKRAAMIQGSRQRASGKSEGSKDVAERNYARALGLSQGLIDSQMTNDAAGSLFANQRYKSNAENSINSLQSYQPSNMWLTGLDTSLQIGSGLLGAYKYGTRRK